MREVIKKIGLMGVGLAAMTEEKAKEIVSEMEKKGEISKEEGKKLVNEIMEERKKQRKEMEEKVSSEVEKAMTKAGLATKDDVKKLDRRLKNIEEMLKQEK